MEIKQIQDSSLFARSGVPVFKYSDSEPSQVSVNLPGQFRSPENILAWANDVVSGDDKECRFNAQTKVTCLRSTD